VQPGTAPRPSAAAARAARRSANRTPCSARTAPRRVRLSGGARPPRHGLNARLLTVTSPSAAASKEATVRDHSRERARMALGDDFSLSARGWSRGGGGSRLLGPVNTTRPAPPRARQPPRPAATPAPRPTPAPGHAQSPLLRFRPDWRFTYDSAVRSARLVLAILAVMFVLSHSLC
jgi:hypothetical protein